MPGLHNFPQRSFGSTAKLVNPAHARPGDTLMIACSEQGTAPDDVSFAEPGRFVILQHLAASMPSAEECAGYPQLSVRDVQRLFAKHEFRHVIVCGHLNCGVIRHWLEPASGAIPDAAAFRERFENGTLSLVDRNYRQTTETQRITIIICEHVLCQVENLLTHKFALDRVLTGKTSFHAWVNDDETARVYGYNPDNSAFVAI